MLVTGQVYILGGTTVELYEPSTGGTVLDTSIAEDSFITVVAIG